MVFLYGSLLVLFKGQQTSGHNPKQSLLKPFQTHYLSVVLQASKNGATGVELDLEFTADGVAILMHDDTVDRTTNGSGPLSQMRLSELGKLDAAAKHRLG